jgi:hypothetical protein
MSDEEDATVLLGGKTEGRSKITTTLVVQQPVSVGGPNVIDITPRTDVTLLLASFVTVIGGLAFGYDMAIGSNVITQIKDTFALTCLEQHVMSSTWFIGAIIASFVGGTSRLDLNLSCAKLRRSSHPYRLNTGLSSLYRCEFALLTSVPILL